MRDIEALLPFLTRHRAALSAATRLQTAAIAGTDEELALAVTEALNFAGGELEEELRLEEAFLLPGLAALDVIESGEVEVLAFDHLRLRVLHLELANDQHNRARATAFAELLLAHTRWEEEELFPAWEERLARWRAAGSPDLDSDNEASEDGRPPLTLITGG